MDFKKILIAVDSSENSLRAVDYVAKLICGSPGFTFTLLYVERSPQRDLFPDEAAWLEACRKAEAENQALLGRAGDLLRQAGASHDSVSSLYLPSCASPLRETPPACGRGPGVAEEILDVLREGGYGTVVVGRRGVSKAEEFLFGSVSSKIMHYAKGCAVWVIS